MRAGWSCSAATGPTATGFDTGVRPGLILAGAPSVIGALTALGTGRRG